MNASAWDEGVPVTWPGGGTPDEQHNEPPQLFELAHVSEAGPKGGSPTPDCGHRWLSRIDEEGDPSTTSS